jgi:methylmalonyl-CoA/ethylmalonyl-CoA epimerase
VQLDHVAVAVPDVRAVLDLLVGRFGGRPDAAGPGAGFRWWQWQFAHGARIEVLEPDGPPDGFLHRFLRARGAGIHHVTFKVPSLAAAVRHARGLGYEVVGIDDSSPFWKEAFLHPKQALGTVVQLAESHPELEPDAGAEWSFPPGPAPRPDPVELLGLRLSCRSADRAHRQWCAALGGRETQRNGELVFRWPDSPLRICVHLDPEAPEGPLGLELAETADIELGPTPQSVLGTPLLPGR